MNTAARDAIDRALLSLNAGDLASIYMAACRRHKRVWRGGRRRGKRRLRPSRPGAGHGNRYGGLVDDE
ncbi:MAG: hypothetical protein ACREDH_15010 [Methylocella sp.]